MGCRVVVFFPVWYVSMLWMRRYVNAVPVLKQVHVVHRHGARTPLPKNPDTLLELAGSSLTPLGQQQLFEVGGWLRQMYNIDGFLAEYNVSEVRLESSDLDRTLTSASALSMGLFPYKAQAADYGTALYESILPEMPGLPVYSTKQTNDMFFRAYYTGNCPVYEARLADLFESEAWKQVEESNEALLTKLALEFPQDADDGDKDESNNKITDGAVVMKQLWNYYDIINVARTECIPNATVFACTSMGPDVYNLKDALSDDEFQELESLAGDTEIMKFSEEIAGNLLGSQLLWKMLNRTSDNAGKFFEYSAHAPTLLSFMSTLGGWPANEPYPYYGSAIIMEVYEDTDANQAKSIRFLYKSFLNTNAIYLPMTQANCEQSFDGEAPPTMEGAAGLSHCMLDAFLAWAMSNTLMTPEEWCEACENTLADVCLQALVAKQIRVEQESQSSTHDEKDNAPLIAGSFFGGFFAGLIIVAAGLSISRRGASPNAKVPVESSDEVQETPAALTDIESKPITPEIN